MQNKHDKPPSQGEPGADGPLGILAGAGRLPIEAAAELKTGSAPIFGFGFNGITNTELESEVESMHWSDLGQLSALAVALRRSNIERIVLLGKVSKSLLLSDRAHFSPDAEAHLLLEKHSDRSDDGILSLVATWLEKQGFLIVDQGVALQSMLASVGPMTRLEPSETALSDFAVGWPVVRALGGSGVGQCVVVKDGAVLAVEAIEGTDETIRRAGLLGGPGAMVIKALRSVQDRRFDLPAIGPDTIQVMVEAGAIALAVEANATLIIERERCVREADAAGITMWGFDAEGQGE